MSVHITCNQSSFRIKDEKKALMALKKEHKKAALMDYLDDDHDFEERLAGAKSFEEFMENFGWELKRDEKNKICAMHFDNSAPSELLRRLKTLVPFVENDSYLMFSGDEEFRVDFTDGKLKINDETTEPKRPRLKTSIVAPEPDSFNPDNSFAFTNKSYSTDGPWNYAEIIARVHIQDSSSIQGFLREFLEALKNHRAQTISSYDTLRLLSLTLTGNLSAESFAKEFWDFIEADMMEHLYVIKNLETAEVRSWSESGQMSDPQSLIEREKIVTMMEGILKVLQANIKKNAYGTAAQKEEGKRSPRMRANIAFSRGTVKGSRRRFSQVPFLQI